MTTKFHPQRGIPFEIPWNAKEAIKDMNEMQLSD